MSPAHNKTYCQHYERFRISNKYEQFWHWQDHIKVPQYVTIIIDQLNLMPRGQNAKQLTIILCQHQFFMVDEFN